VAVAKSKRRKPKNRWFRRAVARWAWRKVNTWATLQRDRIRKTFKPKVVHASATQRQWELQFPDPRRRPELEMERAEEWLAEFVAVLDNGWEIPFQVDVHYRQPTREAAYDAAERLRGPVARTREITDIRAENDLAADMLNEE
jgi:hypothetical protein